MLDLSFVPIIYTLVKGAADYVLHKGQEGIVGNLAYDVARWAGRRGWKVLSELQASDPELNHDLQRSVRKSQLRATEELARVALERARARGGSLLSDEPALKRIHQAAKAELAAVPKALPETRIEDAYLLLLNQSNASAEQLGQMRKHQEQTLRSDLTRWLQSAAHPFVIDELLRDGWTIELRSGEHVERDWQSLVAIAFMDELKNNEPAKKIFDSSILAVLKNREPSLAPIASFDGFEKALDKVLPSLDRIEGKLSEVGHDVKEIKEDVKGIRGLLAQRDDLPVSRWVLALVAGLVIVVIAAVAYNRQPGASSPNVQEMRIETGDQSPVVQGVETEDLVIEYGSKSTEADDRAAGGSEP